MDTPDSMSDITVRHMAEGDLDWVCKMEEVCFPDPWEREFFAKELKRGEDTISIVAESGGGLVGYAIAWHIADEFHIANIAVSPSHRRSGIGSKLMSHLLEEADNIDRMKYAFLEVRIDNAVAIELYHKHGFFQWERKENYYKHGTKDAYVMMKFLEESDPVLTDNEV